MFDAVLWKRPRQSTKPLQQAALHVLEHQAELLPLVDDLAQLHHMRVGSHQQQCLHLALSHHVMDGGIAAFDVLDGDESVGWKVTSGHDGAGRAIADDTLNAIVLHHDRDPLRNLTSFVRGGPDAPSQHSELPGAVW